MKNIVTAGLIAGALATAAASVASATSHDAPAGKEKCYGVVKAGKNDCSAADKSHACMGGAKTDGSGLEWIAVPKGVCEKLVNGSLTPVEAAKDTAE
ncbi:MAG: DUF2282 domain-containing protein [Alphaproteobacteria bacterium]|nr:DUF2282 domain-containing protein [Alphaproteobacteria bacterium]MBU0859023.1 DUF2282 domain-containing protein [Alphaproteobacteria bacterium]